MTPLAEFFRGSLMITDLSLVKEDFIFNVLKTIGFIFLQSDLTKSA